MPEVFDASAEAAAQILHIFGYSVARVPQTQVRSCDLECRFANERLLVEAKFLLADKESQKKAQRGQSFQTRQLVTKCDTMGGELSKAWRQLRASVGESSAFSAIWLIPHGPGSFGRTQRLFSTLYGVAWFDLRAASGPIQTTYFPAALAMPSWFECHPYVDLVMIDDGALLCLHANPFSPRRGELGKSRLVHVMARHGGLFDLDAAAAPLGLYVIDRCVSAKGQAGVLKCLQAKYGLTAVPAEAPEAQSACWPGNEVGSCSPVPGADAGVHRHQILLRVWQERPGQPGICAGAQ